MIHSRIKRLHTEEDTTTKTENNTLPEHHIWKGLYCSLPKKRTREAVLRSRLCKGQTRAGRGSVLWKGLLRRSSKGQTGAGRGRVLGRVCEEGCWRVRCKQQICGARCFWPKVDFSVRENSNLTSWTIWPRFSARIFFCLTRLTQVGTVRPWTICPKTVKNVDEYSTALKRNMRRSDRGNLVPRQWVNL